MAGNICFLKLSEETLREEKDLAKYAAVASVVRVSYERKEIIDVNEVTDAISNQMDIEPARFNVGKLRPDNSFSIKFSSCEDRNTVVGEGYVNEVGFLLRVVPWQSGMYAEFRNWNKKVDIEFTGIPAHAWQRATAKELLSPFCNVEEVYVPNWLSSSFFVHASTNLPTGIPAERFLAIPDLEPVGGMYEVMRGVPGNETGPPVYRINIIVKECTGKKCSICANKVCEEHVYGW